MILGASGLGTKDAQLGALPVSLVVRLGRLIRLVGSYIPTIALSGSYLALVEIAGMYVPTITVTGEVGEDGN